MKDLLKHGFKMSEDGDWVIFKIQISEYKHIKVYKHKCWDKWSCELIQKPFSPFHSEKNVFLSTKATSTWVLKITQLLREAGNIF